MADAARPSCAACLARAMLPQGRLLPAAGDEVVDRARAWLNALSPAAGDSVLRFAELLDRAPLLRAGSRFSKLSAEAQEQLLGKWELDPWLRWPLLALGAIFKVVHFDRPEVYQALGCDRPLGGPAEPARWLTQVRHGDALERDEEIECDVVVAGTGAGGAVVGKELAALGHAVVLLEEGELHRRDAFTGSSSAAFTRFYRPTVLALGNTVVPIMTGRVVGGSTTINGGTCLRGQARALDRWAEELASDELSAAGLAPYYERVERELGVAPTKPPYLGQLPRLLQQGCDRLGWRHSLLPRNAPDCDGQGVCTFGCPTDAKRSTNVSYVPAALSRGAVLLTRVRARRVLVENGRAAGVLAVSLGNGRELRVRARAVVLACGPIHSPLLLLSQGIGNSSGCVGRHLKLHPTTMISGLLPEPVVGYKAVPQAVSCDELKDEGILIYGASAPPDAGALNFAFSGRRLVDLMDSYDRVANLTVIVIDSSEGRVSRSNSGRASIRYWLAQGDAERIHRGLVAGAEILRAAGARRIFPLSPRVPELADERAFQRYRSLRATARDVLLTSVHPLGTCRMSRDRTEGVVGLDHETHDVPGLWVVDASSLPTTPGVNPQMTVMALATRAAEKIHAKLG